MRTDIDLEDCKVKFEDRRVYDGSHRASVTTCMKIMPTYSGGNYTAHVDCLLHDFAFCHISLRNQDCTNSSFLDSERYVLQSDREPIPYKRLELPLILQLKQLHSGKPWSNTLERFEDYNSQEDLKVGFERLLGRFQVGKHYTLCKLVPELRTFRQVYLTRS